MTITARLTSWDAKAPKDERESRAVHQRAALDSLRSSEGWGIVAAELERQLRVRCDMLESTRDNDEQNRGAIEVLRWVLGAPDNGIEAATAEITSN